MMVQEDSQNRTPDGVASNRIRRDAMQEDSADDVTSVTSGPGLESDGEDCTAECC